MSDEVLCIIAKYKTGVMASLSSLPSMTDFLKHIDPIFLIFRRKTETQIIWIPSFFCFYNKIFMRVVRGERGVFICCNTHAVCARLAKGGLGWCPWKWDPSWGLPSAVAPQSRSQHKQWATNKVAPDCRNLVFSFVANFCFSFLSECFVASVVTQMAARVPSAQAVGLLSLCEAAPA